jgi:hypothetical protein
MFDAGYSRTCQAFREVPRLRRPGMKLRSGDDQVKRVSTSELMMSTNGRTQFIGIKQCTEGTGNKLLLLLARGDVGVSDEPNILR